MAGKRQDIWSEEEDELLVNTVLHHIREGGTQIEAFEVVGKKVKRTAAACGYRWNSVVRKKYKKEIQKAKNERLRRVDEKVKEQNVEESKENGVPSFIFEEVLLYLNDVYQKSQVPLTYDKIINGYKEKITALEKELNACKTENEQLKQDLKSAEEEKEKLNSIVVQIRQTVVSGK